MRRLSSVDIEGFVTNVNALAVTLDRKVNELEVAPHLERKPRAC
jgi:hypothetical protein